MADLKTDVQVEHLLLDDKLEALQRALAPYPGAYNLLVIGALLLLAWLANWVTKRILLRALLKVLHTFSWWVRGDDGKPLKFSVIPRLANVVPALVIQAGLAWVPDLPARLAALLSAGCKVFIVLTIALAISNALNLVNEVYEQREDARNRPIKGFLQVIKIIVFALAGLSMVATLLGVSFSHIVTGLGAIMAVLILVFQDTLLSLVASVQISTDGRVRIGDWIEMPSQNADGTVIDIALHTVTVRNWDMTVVTIPTKKLISDSFKNWRGMSESGGRRIKRSLLIDQHSVRFLEAEDIERLKKFALIGDYLASKQIELDEWNRRIEQDGRLPVNRRRLTNFGTFRAYVQAYLQHRSDIHQDMTLLVRQMQPTSTGLPLEIYCFTDTRWEVYEGIQSDIFDHLLAVLPEFGLDVYQESSDAALLAALRQPITANA